MFCVVTSFTVFCLCSLPPVFVQSLVAVFSLLLLTESDEKDESFLPDFSNVLIFDSRFEFENFRKTISVMEMQPEKIQDWFAKDGSGLHNYLDHMLVSSLWLAVPGR